MGEDMKALVERATVTVGIGHLGLAALIASDRAGYSQDPIGWLGRLAENWLWAPIHVIVGLIVLTSLTLRVGRMGSLSLSMGVLLFWSTTMGLWALQLEPDATLGVAALGGILSAVAFALSGLWADRED